MYFYPGTFASTNVTVSEITCTSALVSWDKPINDSDINYTIQWKLLSDSIDRISRPWDKMENVSGQHHHMLMNLLPSTAGNMRYYSVSVSTMKGAVDSEIHFSTNTNGECDIL